MQGVLKGLLGKLKIRRGGQQILGLDIGTGSVKIAQLQATPHGHRLLHLGVEEISPEILGEGVDRGAIFADTIRKIIRVNKIEIDRVISAIAGPSVNVRYIRMPHMSPGELSEAIKWESQKYITFDPEKAILDHVILDEIVEEGVRKVEVMVAAALRDTIDELVSLISAAGLKLMAIDVEPWALLSSFEASAPIKDRGADRTVSLVDIGAGITNINVVERDIPRFSRDVPLAGNHLTQAVCRELKMDFKKAEELKRVHGISLPAEEEPPLVASEPITAPEGPSAEATMIPKETKFASSLSARVSSVMRVVLERLLVEIERSFHYFISQVPGRSIDQIVLSGGSARLKNLPEFLSRSLGIPVVVADPLKNVEFDPGAFGEDYLGPRLASVVGLALRKA